MSFSQNKERLGQYLENVTTSVTTIPSLFGMDSSLVDLEFAVP